MRRHATMLAAIAASACLLTVAILSPWGRTTASRLTALVPVGEAGTVARLAASDPCPADSSDDFGCWDEYYRRILEQYGSHVALFDLKTRYETGGSPRLFCHTFLHEIGEKAGEEYGDVAEAYAHGDPFCRSGYYHGVLEGIFGEAGGEDILAQIDGLCASVKGKEHYSYDYFACVHGIGHGLMAYFDHDLFRSLEGCDALAGAWEESSCYGGVFMENVMADTPKDPSAFLKKDDPLYPCDAVAEKYRTQCYLMQTSHMLTLFDGDFEKVFDACRTAPETYRTACYESAGRDASGLSYGSVPDAFRMCWDGETAQERRACLAGAAVDFLQTWGVAPAEALCNAADQESARTCLDAVGVYAAALEK